MTIQAYALIQLSNNYNTRYEVHKLISFGNLRQLLAKIKTILLQNLVLKCGHHWLSSLCPGGFLCHYIINLFHFSFIRNCLTLISYCCCCRCKSKTNKHFAVIKSLSTNIERDRFSNIFSSIFWCNGRHTQCMGVFLTVFYKHSKVHRWREEHVYFISGLSSEECLHLYKERYIYICVFLFLFFEDVRSTYYHLFFVCRFQKWTRRHCMYVYQFLFIFILN